jgi:hypothetical protein
MHPGDGRKIVAYLLIPILGGQNEAESKVHNQFGPLGFDCRVVQIGGMFVGFIEFTVYGRV